MTPNFRAAGVLLALALLAPLPSFAAIGRDLSTPRIATPPTAKGSAAGHDVSSIRYAPTSVAPGQPAIAYNGDNFFTLWRTSEFTNGTAATICDNARPDGSSNEP